jgi:hypothetical protein
MTKNRCTRIFSFDELKNERTFHKRAVEACLGKLHHGSITLYVTRISGRSNINEELYHCLCTNQRDANFFSLCVEKVDIEIITKLTTLLR